MCRTFTERGYCPYNQKCKFAHGSHELRQNDVPNCRYKTKKCGTYFKLGYCMYGLRCNFVHEELKEEREERLRGKWKMILQHNR